MSLRKSHYTFLSLILVGLLTSAQAFSQYYRYNQGYSIAKGLSVSAMFGPTIFSGDLGLSLPDGSPDTKEVNYMGISYGLMFEKDIIEVVSIRLQATKGTFQGQRENRDQIPYIGFNNDFYEFNLGAHVNWNNVFGGFYQYRPVNFYTVNTISLLTFNEETRFLEGSALNGELDYLHIEEHGNAVAFVTKVGAGAKFRIDENWGIVAEVTGNFAFSDRLDGYVYESPSPSRNRGLYEVETKDNDFYYMAQVGIRYTFQSAGFRSVPKYNRKSYKYKYKRFKYNPGRKRLLRR